MILQLVVKCDKCGKVIDALKNPLVDYFGDDLCDNCYANE